VIYCILWLSPAEAEEYPYTGVTLNKNTNVRAGSNLNYEIVTQLNKGDLVYVAGEWREWLKIRCPEDTPVWMSSDYIENGVIIGSRINIRSGAGLKYNVICQVVEDQVVEVIERSDDSKWAGIKPPEDAYLWVHRDLVGKKGDPDIYLEYHRRRADVKEVLANAELQRRENMKMDPLKIPFDDMIAEYETIARRYSDFTDEAEIASQRVEELGEMKRELDEKLAMEKKAREERIAEEGFEPRYVTAKGEISQLDTNNGATRIFEIEDGGKLVCVVKSQMIDLTLYDGKRIQVWGTEEFSTNWDVPLIEVGRVKRMK